MPRTARCTTARHAVATGSKNPLVDPRADAPVASGAMISTTRTPGALTVGPLRPVILKLAAPAVAMMARGGVVGRNLVTSGRRVIRLPSGCTERQGMETGHDVDDR